MGWRWFLSRFRASHSTAMYEVENSCHERGEKVKPAFGSRDGVKAMHPQRVQDRDCREPVTKHKNEMNDWMVREPRFEQPVVSPPRGYFIL